MVTARIALAALALVTTAAPAAAQWSRVTEVPNAFIYSVWTKGDTITAGSDSTVYVSTNGGLTWKGSTTVAPGVFQVEAVRMRNGRLYAGTLGKGVFISDDLGDTWTAYNQNLVGGIGNSQLVIKDLHIRGDSLYAATSGAGPWVRNFNAGAWTRFGNALEVNQASNMNSITSSGSRLFATGGANGTVFFRDPGPSDWTLSWLNNVGPAPGLAALTAIGTGNGWVVGSNIGPFFSPLGQSPWAFFDVVLGTQFVVSFAMRGSELFASFGAGPGTTFESSQDDGATWAVVDDLPATFTFEIAIAGNTLYAGRFDGLWRRGVPTVSVPAPESARLRFAIAGAHPVRDVARFAFELPEAGHVAVDLFDLAGRHVSTPIEGSFSAGPHDVAWSASVLAPGVYQARLRAVGRTEVIRLVRI